jgi:hypothetical protein
MSELRQQISEILVKHDMPTRQAAIGEIEELILDTAQESYKKGYIDGGVKQINDNLDVSLCPSCYCMTHTVDGRCGKCGAAKESTV